MRSKRGFVVVLVAGAFVSAAVRTGPACASASQDAEQSAGRTVNLYWLPPESALEFAEIERHQGRTLSDWVKRSKAKETLPNRRGHYLLYRHRSPEDSSEITYWFGPFDKGEEVSKHLSAMRQATATLRSADPTFYATARVVRMFAPEDDSIQKLTEADPAAIDLAWLLEQAQRLDAITLAERQLVEIEKKFAASRLTEITSVVAGASRAVDELELESAAADDTTISRQLFDGREALVGPVADLAREELALWAADAAMPELMSHDLMAGPLGPNDLVRLRTALGRALLAAGFSSEETDRKLAYFSAMTKAAGNQPISSTEVRAAIQATGSDLLAKAAASASDPTLGTTRAIAADAYQEAVLWHTQRLRGAAPGRLKRFFPGEGATADGSGGAPRVASQLLMQRSVRDGMVLPGAQAQSPAHDGVSTKENVGALAGRQGPAPRWDDVQQAIQEALPSFMASQVLSSSRSGGPTGDTEQIREADQRAASHGVPIRAALAVAPEAGRRGVKLADAMSNGLNAAAASAFQASMRAATESALTSLVSQRLGRNPQSLQQGITPSEADAVRAMLDAMHGPSTSETGRQGRQTTPEFRSENTQSRSSTPGTGMSGEALRALLKQAASQAADGEGDNAPGRSRAHGASRRLATGGSSPPGGADSPVVSGRHGASSSTAAGSLEQTSGGGRAMSAAAVSAAMNRLESMLRGAASSFEGREVGESATRASMGGGSGGSSGTPKTPSVSGTGNGGAGESIDVRRVR